MPNKTYLRTHLVFEEVEHIVERDEDSLRDAVRTLPRTVYESYERILSRSRNPKRVRKLLSIVMAAKKPLSVALLSQAWSIKPDCPSYDQLSIAPEAQFKEVIHGLCGLFVIVYQDHVYLLHQTAREFLLSPDPVPSHPFDTQRIR